MEHPSKTNTNCHWQYVAWGVCAIEYIDCHTPRCYVDLLRGYLPITQSNHTVVNRSGGNIRTIINQRDTILMTELEQLVAWLNRVGVEYEIFSYLDGVKVIAVGDERKVNGFSVIFDPHECAKVDSGQFSW